MLSSWIRPACLWHLTRVATQEWKRDRETDRLDELLVDCPQDKMQLTDEGRKWLDSEVGREAVD